MASPQAIASARDYVTADQINYEPQKVFSHPSYRYEPQYANTNGQPIVLNANQTPVVITLPSLVFNLFQSYLLYSVNIPRASVGNYIWYACQALKEISQIQFYAGSSMYMADIQNLQNYLDIVMKREEERDDFLSNGIFTGTYTTNGPINVIPALRNSNQTQVPNAARVDPGTGLIIDPIQFRTPNPSEINYQEPAYFNVSALNTGISYLVQFPLGLIKWSIFSIDKSMYFGQNTYLRVTFGPISKICYMSTSNAHPSANGKASYLPAISQPSIGAPYDALNAPYQGPIQPVALQLMLAVETNQSLIDQIKNKVESGMSMFIPWIQPAKVPNQGTNQTITHNLDPAMGKMLMRVIHSVYNAQEDIDTAYDHSNTPMIAGTVDINGLGVNQKIQSYYTSFNGQRIQNLSLDCTYSGPFLDYMQQRRFLRRSILGNLNVFQYNWHHVDDFCNFDNDYDMNNNNFDLIAGKPMNGMLTWSFNANNVRNTNNSFQHYTWFIFTRQLMINRGGVTVE